MAQSARARSSASQSARQHQPVLRSLDPSHSAPGQRPEMPTTRPIGKRQRAAPRAFRSMATARISSRSRVPATSPQQKLGHQLQALAYRQSRPFILRVPANSAIKVSPTSAFAAPGRRSSAAPHGPIRYAVDNPCRGLPRQGDMRLIPGRHPRPNRDDRRSSTRHRPRPASSSARDQRQPAPGSRQRTPDPQCPLVAHGTTARPRT